MNQLSPASLHALGNMLHSPADAQLLADAVSNSNSVIQQYSFANGLVLAHGLIAHAGGGQSGGFPITTKISDFGTVATTGDSALLPGNAGGVSDLIVMNHGSNSMNIFPALGEQIDSLGTNAAYALAAGKTVSLNCAVAGAWTSSLFP
jgi:hypothetical protein